MLKYSSKHNFFVFSFIILITFLSQWVGKDLNTTVLSKSKDSDHPQLAPCVINGEKPYLTPCPKGSLKIRLGPCLKGDKIS